MCPLSFSKYSGTSPLGHVYSRDTSIRGHKIWSLKNVHIIFESVTFIEGTYLFRGKGHVYLVPKTGFDSIQGTP